jgi:ubiquinone/menaquinone biosynthesis C-methylase UbiE
MAIGGEFTTRLLTDAGVGPGMRVLDVGCGAGDVSLLAAGLVGAGGSVLGIDRPSRRWRQRASASGRRGSPTSLLSGAT